MDTKTSAILSDLLNHYIENCQNETKSFIDTIEQGKAVDLFNNLLENYQRSSNNRTELIVNGLRLLFCLNYSMNSKNGIPLIEFMNNSIDTDKKELVINAVTSQRVIMEYMIKKGVDITVFKNYYQDKEILEYAIGDKNKSTGVLKRNLDRIEQDKSKLIKLAKKNNYPKKLIDIFINTKAYYMIMDLLVSKYYIQKTTYVWIDKNSGYKSLICAFLKDLEAKKYFKPNISLNWEMADIIIQNSFKIKIGSNKTYYSAELPLNLKDLIPPISIAE